MTGAPVLVEAEVLEQAARSPAREPGLVSEALEAPDDARTLAAEMRARLDAGRRDLAELERRLADAPGDPG